MNKPTILGRPALEYLNEQFPATVGHLPLESFLNHVEVIIAERDKAVASLGGSEKQTIASTIEVDYLGAGTFAADAGDPESLGIQPGQTAYVITKENLSAILDNRNKIKAEMDAFVNHVGAKTFQEARDVLIRTNAGHMDQVEQQFNKIKEMGRELKDADSIYQNLGASLELRREECEKARKCVAFFASVIKSGESWSPACQKALDEALGKA